MLTQHNHFRQQKYFQKNKSPLDTIFTDWIKGVRLCRNSDYKYFRLIKYCGSAIIRKCTGILKMHRNSENAQESWKCTRIPKMHGNPEIAQEFPKNISFWRKIRFFWIFFWMQGNTENLVIQNGNTEFLYPENSGIPNSQNIPIPELQYSRRKIIREWPLPNLYPPGKKPSSLAQKMQNSIVFSH